MDNTSTKAKVSLLSRICMWAGLVCIGQFCVFAIIGVIRGYSVQSWTPQWIMLAGIFLLLLFYIPTILSQSSKDEKCQAWPSYLISFCIILTSLMGMQQGRYWKKGDNFYQEKDYSSAIVMYEKEVGTWYLRLKYNYDEDQSLFGIARAYCQLGDFEKGRESYQRLLKMARGYYQERGQAELAELDTELKKIAEFKKQLATTSDDNEKANILFDMALAYRRIECAKKAREQYELIQTLDVPESWKEQAKKFAADEQW